MRTIISDATLLTMEEATPVIHGSIGVEDGRIAFLGEYVPQEGDRVIDGQDHLVLPGFVNAHAHSPMTLLRGVGDDLPLSRWLQDAIFPREDRMNQEDFYWGAMAAMAEMTAAGTVAFSEMYMGAGEIARAADESGLRAIVGRGLACGSEERGEMGEKLRLATDFCGAFQDHPRIGFSVAPHAEYTCSPAFLAACGELAQERGWLFHTHASETESEHRECVARHGMTPVALLEHLGCLSGRAVLAHCVHVTEEDMGILAQRRAAVAHCPESNLKLGSGMAPAAALRKRGVTVCMGTDGAASNNDLDLLSETRTAAFLQKGMERDAGAISAFDALRMATVEGRRALGLPGGTLSLGAPADLILLNISGCHMLPLGEDPYAAVLYCAKSSDVALTMVDGRILYRNGVFYALDVERIRREVTRSRGRILSR